MRHLTSLLIIIALSIWLCGLIYIAYQEEARMRTTVPVVVVNR